MRPHKRAPIAEASAVTATKRQKVSTESDDVAVDITAQNAVQSPLLRLPAELRNTIWQLLFGHTKVFVRSRPVGPEVPREIILSLNPVPYGPSARPKIPQLVSKQYWAETLNVFFSATTFDIQDTNDLHTMALSPSLRVVVSRIQRLQIHSYLYDWKAPKFDTNLAGILTTSIMGKFTNLEGFKWKIMFVYKSGRLLEVTDVMGDALWKTLKLPTIVRAIQQHKLKNDLTFVDSECFLKDSPLSGFDTTALSNAIKGHMLHYTPRRTSRRGKETL